MKHAGRVARALMGLLFLISTGLQYNDPDPLRWVAIYGAAAAACWLPLKRPWFAASVGATALVWALSLAPRALARAELRDAVGEMRAAADGPELLRELGGLCIVAVCMLVLTVIRVRRSREVGTRGITRAKRGAGG